MRVLHLVGSPTDTFFFDLSVLYASGCLNALDDPERYEHIVAVVSPDGRWRFCERLSETGIADAPTCSLAEAIAHLERLRPDVAVPQMFCRAGMTTYRSLLDLLAIPYAGNRPNVMELGADKARCRVVVSAAGVDVPDAQVVGPRDRPTLEMPCVVKPVDADNSVGVALVRDSGELDAALDDALAHSDRALVERFVPLGREVRVGVLERDGELLVLPLEEYSVDPERKPIRDAADKLARQDDGQLRLIAKDVEHAWIVDAADPINAVVGDLARRTHRALACRDYSLFDVRIDPQGRPWFIEAGLYCSFAPSSVIAVMAAAAGIDVAELFAVAARQALARESR